MILKSETASLLTNAFFKTRPDVFDLVETVLTEESLEEFDALSSQDEVKVVLKWLDAEIKKLKGASYTEILGLLDLLDQYEEAVSYDCISLGLRLRNVGTEDFTWGDLLAIVQQSPRSSALFRAMHPEEAEWGMQEQLLALVADYLAAGNWQRGQGSKKNYPKPIPRPGVTSPDKKFGQEAVSMEEMKAWLGW